MRRASRARIAFAVLMGLIVFLLAALYHQSKLKDANIARLQATTMKLQASNDSVVNTLALILTHVLAGEKAALDAGKTPTTTVESVLAQVRDLDQGLVQEALQKAYAAQAGATGTRGAAGPAGATGATGRAGPPGPAGPAGATATTAAATTSTVRSTTTTAAKPSTTTTTSCLLDVLGLKLGC